MAPLATKGMGQKTNSERQKRIQGLLGFRCWVFRIGTWATKDTLLFLVYERLDSESPNKRLRVYPYFQILAHILVC
jgi:hypothetical protein